MAHIRTKKLKNGKNAYLVVYTDPAGIEQSKQFAKRGDLRTPGTAEHFKVQIESNISAGTYVDPGAGNITFRDYATQWRENLHRRDTYHEHLDTILRVHLFPVLGSMRMGAIRRPELQRLVRELCKKTTGPKRAPRPLSPNYIEHIVQVAAMIFRAAVIDEVIPKSPMAKKLNLPSDGDDEDDEGGEIVIPSTEQLIAIADAIFPRFRVAVLGAAGTGLRAAELRGLDATRMPVLDGRVRAGIVRVTRQLKVKPVRFAPPKTKAGRREVPITASVAELFNAHLDRYGWGRPGEPEGSTGLLLTSRLGGPVGRTSLNDCLRPIFADLGFPPRSGMHVFRHYYASMLIYNGEDPKTVQKRMGHATIAETMDTYGHLWPDAQDRSGAAIDAIFGAMTAAPASTTRATRLPLRAVR